MKRDPFDERCTCDHEETRGGRRYVCACVMHLAPPKTRCMACASGFHKMRAWPRP